MILHAEQFALRILHNDCQPRLMVICGKQGIGKSTVSRKIVEAVNLLGVTCWNIGRCPKPPSTSSFAWNALASIAPGDRNAQTLWIDAVEADLLFLDDVGAEVDRFKNQQPTENLRLILEERRSKWTIITTNVLPKDWASNWDARVEDRLYRNSIRVMLPTAPSYLRTQKTK